MSVELDDNGLYIFPRIVGEQFDYELILDEVPLGFRIVQDAPTGRRIVSAVWKADFPHKVHELARGYCALKDARELCTFYNKDALIRWFTVGDNEIEVKWRYLSRKIRLKQPKMDSSSTISRADGSGPKVPWIVVLETGEELQFFSTGEKQAKYRAYRIARERNSKVVGVDMI
jgi:hypothetical protein